MKRTARLTRTTAQQTAAAADQLLGWLRTQRTPILDHANEAPDTIRSSAAAAPSAVLDIEAVIDPIGNEPGLASGNIRPTAKHGQPAGAGTPLRLLHPDWLHHRLVVTGPTEVVGDFQAVACGAGVIPWRLDLDAMEEDLLHLLVAPRAPQRRRLSVAGARVLARQLRAAVELRHGAALARVDVSRACCLDLHALVPVPPDVLHVGPDDPDALAWLWAHWGTTDALRHVVVEPVPKLRTLLPSGTMAARYSFWSADWTPWPALAAVAAQWPALRLDTQPTYGLL